MLFVDIRIGESGFKSKRWSLADPLHRRCAAELSALPRADPTVDARTHSRIRARWFGPGTESVRPRFEREMQQATGLVAQGPHENVSDPADFVSGHAALRFWGGRRACCFNSSCSSGRRSRRRSWCARLRRGARGRFLCAATTKPAAQSLGPLTGWLPRAGRLGLTRSLWPRCGQRSRPPRPIRQDCCSKSCSGAWCLAGRPHVRTR